MYFNVVFDKVHCFRHLQVCFAERLSTIKVNLELELASYMDSRGGECLVALCISGVHHYGIPPCLSEVVSDGLRLAASHYHCLRPILYIQAVTLIVT